MRGGAGGEGLAGRGWRGRHMGRCRRGRARRGRAGEGGAGRCGARPHVGGVLVEGEGLEVALRRGALLAQVAIRDAYARSTHAPSAGSEGEEAEEGKGRGGASLRRGWSAHAHSSAATRAPSRSKARRRRSSSRSPASRPTCSRASSPTRMSVHAHIAADNGLLQSECSSGRSSSARSKEETCSQLLVSRTAAPLLL